MVFSGCLLIFILGSLLSPRPLSPAPSKRWAAQPTPPTGLLGGGHPPGGPVFPKGGAVWALGGKGSSEV